MHVYCAIILSINRRIRLFIRESSLANQKEDIPMKQFLRDVLVAVVAGILVAVAVRLMNH